MKEKTDSAAHRNPLAAASAALALSFVFAFGVGCRPAPNAETRPASLAPAASPGKVESPLPAPTGFVNDYAKVFDDESRRRLEEKMRRLKERGNVEFAVVTVETTGERSTDDYSLAVAKGWGVGSKETGDGLLLLLAVRDRRWRVQVSRSLEAALPDAFVDEACRSAAPLFRDGRYAEGVAECVDGLTARLAEKKDFKLDE